MNAGLWVAIGGALGAIARYGVAQIPGLARPSGFPWPTFWVNVLGCALIGALLGLGDEREWLSDRLRLFLVSGFLGSFTTFSTFGYETLALVDRGQYGLAASYVLGSLVASALALGLGIWLMRAV